MEKFQQRPQLIMANRLDEELHFTTEIGHVIGLPGEWLVQYPDGSRNIMDHTTFTARFEPLSDEGRRMYNA